MWRFLENHPFLTEGGIREHDDEARVLADLSVSMSLACLLTLGGVFFPFSLS